MACNNCVSNGIKQDSFGIERESNLPFIRINFGAKESYPPKGFGTWTTVFFTEYNFVQSKVRISWQVVRISLDTTDDLMGKWIIE